MSDDSGFLDDFLMDQDKRQIIYDSVDELKKDVKKLLSDSSVTRSYPHSHNHGYQFIIKFLDFCLEN